VNPENIKITVVAYPFLGGGNEINGDGKTWRFSGICSRGFKDVSQHGFKTSWRIKVQARLYPGVFQSERQKGNDHWVFPILNSRAMREENRGISPQSEKKKKNIRERGWRTLILREGQSELRKMGTGISSRAWGFSIGARG